MVVVSFNGNTREFILSIFLKITTKYSMDIYHRLIINGTLFE